MSCRHCGFEDRVCDLFIDEDSVDDLGLACNHVTGVCSVDILGDDSVECDEFEECEEAVE